jgi:hypothetical protein
MPGSLTRDALRVAVGEDPKHKALIELISKGRVDKAEKDMLGEYSCVLGELTVTEDGLVLRGTQLGIPQSLQRDVIAVAHEGHMGMAKTKALLRYKVWFPGIDSQVEELIRSWESPGGRDKINERVKSKDREQKVKTKAYADGRRRAREVQFEVGDTVIAKQKRKDKWKTPFGASQYKVVATKGSMVTVSDGDRTFARDRSFFKKLVGQKPTKVTCCSLFHTLS